MNNFVRTLFLFPKTFGLNDTEISFWHNPYTCFHVPRGFFPFEEVYFEIEEHKLLINKSKSSQTVLELQFGQQYFFYFIFRIFSLFFCYNIEI
jgi:hypothetical protein